MTDALANIARLRRLVEHLPELGEDGDRLAGRLRDYLDARGAVTLEQALGLAAADAWTWWRLEQREAERAASRSLVEACGDAKKAHAWLQRFARGRGRFLDTATTYDDERAQAASDYLRATGGRVPEAPRTLERAAEERDR